MLEGLWSTRTGRCGTIEQCNDQAKHWQFIQAGKGTGLNQAKRMKKYEAKEAKSR
jgi:hypothetical protein